MIDDLEYSTIYVELYENIKYDVIHLSGFSDKVVYQKVENNLKNKLGLKVKLSEGAMCHNSIINHQINKMKNPDYKSNFHYYFKINVKIERNIFKFEKFSVNLNDGKIGYHKSIIRGEKINTLVDE